MESYIMALDQGTTSSRCILFNSQGKLCYVAQKEYTQLYPKQGWVEHSPIEIWYSQMTVMKEVLNSNHILASQIKAIGITNQRETAIVWDKYTGEPIYNAIVWQCRRTAPIVDQLKELGYGELIREKTGLIADAYFSGTKIQWILDHVEGAGEKAKRGDLLFGTVDTWLIWKLTKGAIHRTDFTNASRTMIFNIHTLEWDQVLLDLLRIPRAMLPEVYPSSGEFGYTDKELLGVSIPITGVAGDQQAALFGQGCVKKGDAKNTYGTGCFLLMNTGKRAVQSSNGLLTTIAAGRTREVSYALEGSVFVAGAAIQWLRDELGIVQSAKETEQIAASVPDNNGVYVVPAFTGLAAPYWDPYARGTVLGITRGTSKAHFIRATLESLAYQTYDVLKAMEKDAGVTLKELKVDGGASSNNFILQFQADLLDRPVVRPSCVETTALGAAYLAGLSIGFWDENFETYKEEERSKVFIPSMNESKREEYIKTWEKAVSYARDWAKI